MNKQKNQENIITNIDEYRKEQETKRMNREIDIAVTDSLVKEWMHQLQSLPPLDRDDDLQEVQDRFAVFLHRVKARLDRL